MNNPDFTESFRQLAGNEPLSWQARLYNEHFAKGAAFVPSVIDVPTGLGKTMVMAIWLIARANELDVPTRLIYVVDRRTVVDQASDLARNLQRKFGKEKLAISTLRGQLADNREWSSDPSRSAIIIGTVDLIGSGLLFSGYRSGFKTKPLQAGLLGQDSLLVLDEAHLSRPFEKLLKSISRFQTSQGKPMRIIRMSATSGASDIPESVFTLQMDSNGDLAGEDASDPVIKTRFTAKKTLRVKTVLEKKKLTDEIADTAIELAQNTTLRGKRIVVFVRKPDDATRIRDVIRKRDSTKTKSGPYADSVEVLTGTMRGLERDELLKRPVLERFLNGDEDPEPEANKRPVFLISTSAGEVGFDLNADHLVGDTAPIDSWIQRLGRVNRRGTGEATVILIKQEIQVDKTDFDKACLAATSLLADGMEVSPKALAGFTRSLRAEQLKAEQLKAATTPTPKMAELTDILLDAWSMTSIIEPMPGRPEVAPWLRGIDDDLPQTTIAWRAELDLHGFAELDTETIEEWFDIHRILTHETLNVPTSVAAKWFLDRWENLSDADKSTLRDKLVIVDRAGFNQITVRVLVDQLSRRSGDNTAAIRNAELVLPASFGGIERHVGLLDASMPKEPKPPTATNDETNLDSRAQRQAAPDVADERERYRVLITKTEDGQPVFTPVGSGSEPSKLKASSRYRIDLDSDDGYRVTLLSYVPRREKPELGSAEPETLPSHVGKVRRAVDAITAKLSISDDIIRAAGLAADFHDHGKDRDRWQRLLVLPLGSPRPEGPLAKSGGEMKRDPRGYRHEFGSLREFIDAHAGKISDDVFDLATHLIATHHGRGRPHFPKGGFDPDAESRSNDIHTDAIRRFARLQRKYGHWHLAWLENLLRCADAIASTDQGVEDAPAFPSETEDGEL